MDTYQACRQGVQDIKFSRKKDFLWPETTHELGKLGASEHQRTRAKSAISELRTQSEILATGPAMPPQVSCLETVYCNNAEASCHLAD
jgi:hypothetical protein